jgi:uncharacterized membrane protein
MTAYDHALRTSPSPRFVTRHLRVADIGHALSRGWEDFWAMPSHLLFLGLLYPLAGLVIGLVTAGENAYWLLYPLLSGFVLIGPFAAIGLYEMSRLRERGEKPTWQDAFNVLHSPNINSVLALGALLAVLFLAWLTVAHSLYMLFFGDEPAKSYEQFFGQLLGTQAGVSLIVIGNILGLFFAIAALALSVFSFPLMLDRHVGLAVALRTTLRATWDNPLVVALWGLMIAVLLAIGMAAALMGLAIVMPVLAHATWHFYRRAIGPPLG